MISRVSSRWNQRWPVLAILALCGPACERRALVDGVPATMDCKTCHGGEKNAAPPFAVNGATSTTEVGVGAHQAHVNDGEIAGMYGCDACHPVVTAMDGDSHPDPLARGTTVLFGDIAKTNGADPSWDKESRTCANTYCHGATIKAAKSPAPPVWTRVDGSQIRCNSCHADNVQDLDETHAKHQDYKCDTCHGDVVSSDLKIVGPTLHVDGLVEVKMAAGTWDAAKRSCADTSIDCHGTGSIPW
jgi:predicted CxxxxCH...CXXCH cytochrome family protein